MSHAKEISMLKSFAKTGNVNAFKRLKLNWPEAETFARHDRNIALRMAAANGNANILEELRVNWGLNREDARALDNYALKTAAEKNHLGVVQELRVGYGLTMEDGRTALSSAARNCDTRNIFREFRENWGLNLSDVLSDNHFVLTIIAAHGCLDLLRELITNWGLSAVEAKSILATAAHYGEVVILRELKLLGLTTDDVVSTGALEISARNNHDLVLREFKHNWGVTNSQIRFNNNQILKTAISDGDISILKCLRENWEFSIDDFPPSSEEWNVLVRRFEHPRGLDRYNINLRMLSEFADHWRFDLGAVHHLLEITKKGGQRLLTGEDLRRFDKKLEEFLNRYPVQQELAQSYTMIYQRFCDHLNENPDTDQVLNHVLKKYGISNYDWTPKDRSAACRLLYEEYLNWTRNFDPVVEKCYESEDIVDDRPLSSMSAKSVIKIPDHDSEKFHCYGKQNLKLYLKSKSKPCRMDGDYFTGDCHDYLRTDLISYPDELKEILRYDDRFLQFIGDI